MEREEILQKAKRKCSTGEVENTKTNKGNWIALICTGINAVAFMILEGALGHHSAIFAIGAICYGWASIFYTMQFILAKRPWQVLFGSVLHGLAFITMIVLYIISNIQGW